MTGQNKALAAGTLTGVSLPLNDVLQWLFIQQLHMPDNVAASMGMVVMALAGWALTYYMPNVKKAENGESGQGVG